MYEKPTPQALEIQQHPPVTEADVLANLIRSGQRDRDAAEARYRK